MKKRTRGSYCAAYADASGNIWDAPRCHPAFRTGNRFVDVAPEKLIPLPYGSTLFMLPGRIPIRRSRNGRFEPLTDVPSFGEVYAVSAFCASGYLRTYLPAFMRKSGAPVLPMWAYAGLAFHNGSYVVPAMRIDEDPRSDPAIHEDEEALLTAIKEERRRAPRNKLVEQLATCALTYRCLCAGNFFLGRYEAPVPTTPSCNADCVGCLSHQPSGAPFPPSQNRLNFAPTAEDIADVIIRHFARVENAVASFGQGCEGEPLMRAEDIARAITLVRATTDRGTININTNGSLPKAVRRLIDAGLDSIRVSLNSPTEEYYTRYHRPRGYRFSNVCATIAEALDAGIFVSINLFFMPGFTDMETEVESLIRFLERFPVHMIQTRNMNIDPDYYFESIGYQESDPIGVENLINLLRERFPAMRLGYYNPPLRI